MPVIYDNIEHDLLKGLANSITVSFRSDFCVGYFNLRGWKELSDMVEKYTGGEDTCCRLLVGMQRLPIEDIREIFSSEEKQTIDNKRAIELKKRLAQEFKDQLTIGVPTDRDEIGLRTLSRQIKDKKVRIKLFLRYLLHAKLYLVFRDDAINPIIGFVGSSNLTLAGLSKQGELNVDVLDKDAAQKLADWFKERWNDQWCIDISDELTEIIDESWAGERLLPPYYIYLKMAYHLSSEALVGLSEFDVPKIFKKELLEFQQKAVRIAAHHIHKRNGVVIGDVVGLGKTIIASAVAKIFEEDFFLETLILCPKNLVKMWEDYAYKYQLRAKVLSQSVVQTELPEMKRYRFVIIDESHNLRNREGKRYKIITEYLKRNACKVVLLTATPYNKTFIDLSSQLRLFLPEDQDLGICPEFEIRKMGAVAFSAKYQIPLHSLGAFEKSTFPEDWRELMRLYLIRRTRSFIKNNYAKTDPDNQRKYLTFDDGSRFYFPDRIPKRAQYKFDPDDSSDQYAKLYAKEVVDLINSLKLPRYGLGQEFYRNPSSGNVPTPKETLILENLSRAGYRLKGFARTNLFKRLESSGHSFLLSVSRHILRNHLFLYAMENHLPFPIGQQEMGEIDELLYKDIDADQNSKMELIVEEAEYKEKARQYYQYLSTGKQFRYDWIASDYFNKKVMEDLEKDSRTLLQIIEKGKDWNPDKDRQLNALFLLCHQKHLNDKIIVFTQYSDTAEYLYKELCKRGLKKCEVVTGSSEDPTTFAYRFSPVSNEKRDKYPEESEIRVMISTDVLSEGQNLQDGHIIVNYDLPWALIRLIQRAGRVDRIGQKSDKIFCYSFLPEKGLEQIINLRGRLITRITENAEVVGSDETFFEGDPINIADLYNEKSGIYDDQDSESEIDLASYAYQIWKNATDKDPQLKKIIPDLPNVVYSTKSNENEAEKEGAIVYTKTAGDNDVLTWLDRKGQVFTHSQFTILKAVKCEPDTPALERLPEHHRLVAKSMEYTKEVDLSLGGQLGRPSSVRYRLYMQLNRYYEANRGTLFVTENLKKTIDEIYRFPLKEAAKETISRQMKTSIPDEMLANLAVALRDEDKLCITKEDEQANREPKIICSMGMKNV